MKIDELIKRNRIANIVLQLIGVLLPVISFPYIARALQPEGLGAMCFAQALIAVFTIISQLGIPIYALRALEDIKDDQEELERTVHELLILNLILSFAAYIVLGACFTFVPLIRDNRVLILIFSASIFLNAIGMSWLYKALDKYEKINFVSVVCKLLTFIGMIIFVKSSESEVICTILVVAGIYIPCIVDFIMAGKLISFESVGDYDIKRHLEPVVIYGFMAGSMTLILNLDTVMLGFMTNFVWVGIFQVAVWIKIVLVGVVTTLGTLIIPKASYYIEQGLQADFEIMSSKALNFILVVATPIAVFFMIFGSEILGMIFGEAYGLASILLKFTMPALLFTCLTNIIGMEMLLPLNEEKGALKAVVAGAIADFVLNLILIPKYGAIGAGISNLIATVIVLVLQVVALKKCVTQKIMDFLYIKVIIGICFGVLAIFIIKLFKLGSFVTVILSAIVYILIYGVMLLYSGEPMVKEIKDSIVAMFE